MQVAFETAQDVTIARVAASRIDAATAEDFRAALAPAIDGPGRRLRLDLGEVVFLDSSALGVLVWLMKQLGPERGLEIAGVGPRLWRIFALTGTDRIFTILGPDAGA